MNVSADPERARARLFQGLPIGKGGLVLPNRIWLPAMVTWRGTEDGFVTEAVREIYLRYALGGAGMIVLEATGIRDIASGPLLRLSHDRYIPGLRSMLEEMRAVHPGILPEVYQVLGVDNSVANRASYGGTAPAQVLAQVRRWQEALG